MARNDRESAWATFWQLKVLVTVADKKDWLAAASMLDLQDKYQLERILTRLSKKLGVDGGIIVDVDGRPEVPDHCVSIVERARSILDRYDEVKEAAGGSRRRYIVRLDGYWAHVATFAGKVIGDFEREQPDVTIRLVSTFGRHRDHSGAGILAALVGGQIDMVISPDRPERLKGFDFVSGHRWALMAALSDDHRLVPSTRDHRTVGAPDLAEYPVLCSPRGHRTRTLLEELQSAVHRFNIVTEGDEPAALVALGAIDGRVPIVASDSHLTLPRGGRLPSSWRALVTSSDEVVGGQYWICWREKGQPAKLVPHLRRLAKALEAGAEPLSERIAPWR